MCWGTSIDEMVEQICCDPLEDGVIVSVTPVPPQIPMEIRENDPEAQNNNNLEEV